MNISTLKSNGEPSLCVKCSYTHENIRHFFLAWLTDILPLAHKRTGTLHNGVRGSLGAAVPCAQELPWGSSRQATGGGGDTMNSEKVEECWLNRFLCILCI